MTPLAIRADANAGIGAGHVMRSLALAEGWARAGGGVITWFAVEPPQRLRAAATARGVSTCASRTPDAAWRALLDWTHANQSGWVVLDSYAIGFAAQCAILDAGARLLVIDDCAASPEIACDVLLNQNIHAERLTYRTAPDTRRLLGPRFALLRGEFLGPIRERDFTAPARRLLITFGWADAHDQARRVTQLLPGLTPPIDAVVVAGQAHPHGERDSEERAAGVSIRWENGTDDMAALLRWADLVICAAGSTCWEVAHHGVPALTLIVSENQAGIGAGLHDEGVVRGAGWYHEVDDASLAAAIEALRRDPARSDMSRRGRALVDGRGADRVADAMLQVERASAVRA